MRLCTERFVSANVACVRSEFTYDLSGGRVAAIRASRGIYVSVMREQGKLCGKITKKKLQQVKCRTISWNELVKFKANDDLTTEQEM